MGASRPQKRRKLTPSSQQLWNLQTIQQTKPTVITTMSPRCITCHRALNITHGSLTVCSRCSSPICAICSRTCTASPTSMPPTPHLTRSPTPSPTPPQSPRRSALAIHSVNTNISDILHRGHLLGTPDAVKRRKAVDEDDHNSADAWEQILGEFNLTYGCGRTICRNCCTENVDSDSITCYDCLIR